MAAPWSFAVPDWQERIKAGKSLVPALPVDRGEYIRVTKIFNKLRLPDVIGKPPLSEAAGPWFREIAGTVLGSIDRATGQRQVPELFLMAPKKSSKTSYGAAFMVTALLMNERPRGEFLLVAPTLAIAHLAFNQAIGMIEADDDGFLQKRMRPTPHLRRIIDRRTQATLEIKAFDSSILTGVKPAGVLLDELHEIAKSPAAQRVIGQIRGGMIANPEAFFAMITTQSDERPRGAFKAELDNARAIRDGKARGRTLSVLYEFPDEIANDGDRWKDSSNWWMVTPNLDRSVTLPKLQEGLERAERDGMEEVIRWASQHLNIEIGMALRSDRWAGAEFWKRSEDETLTRDEIIRRSEVIVFGIDGGGLDDLFGFCMLGRCRETKRWLCWSHAWCHASVLERRKSIASLLEGFAADGDLTVVDDRLEDVSEIVAIIKDVKDRGLLAVVAADPMGLDEFIGALKEIDVTEEAGLVMGVKQGGSMMNALKAGERALVSGALVHCPSRLMDWSVANIKIEPLATTIRATKQNAGDAKIDPAMAMFDAIAAMVLNPQPAGVVDVMAMIA